MVVIYVEATKNSRFGAKVVDKRVFRFFVTNDALYEYPDEFYSFLAELQQQLLTGKIDKITIWRSK